MNNRTLTIRLDEGLEQGLKLLVLKQDAAAVRLCAMHSGVSCNSCALSASGARLCLTGKVPAGSRMMMCLRLSPEPRAQ